MSLFVRLWRALTSLFTSSEKAVPARLRMSTPLGVRRLEERRVLNADIASALLPAAVADFGTTESAPANPQISTAQQAAGEVLFIDARVSDWQVLAAGVRDGIDVHLIDQNSDGLSQIANYLQTSGGAHTQFSAIHIVSHGDSGALYLGAGTVTSETLSDFSSQLTTIGTSLTAEGDILLYGCEVGEGPRGGELLQSLSTLTGADVAASTDLTGAEFLGGDWDLEAEQGDIEADLAFAAAARESYGSVLPLLPAVTATQAESQKIVASDAAAGDNHGASVAISGNLMVVGASGADGTSSNSGAAYVYQQDGFGVWNEVAILTATDSDLDDFFGVDVAISGDTIFVGAGGDDGVGIDAGAVYVFVSDGMGGWTQQAKLTAAGTAAGDAFGSKLAAGGDTLVIGARRDDAGVADGGAAYVFLNDGMGNWDEDSLLLSGDIETDDFFGGSIAIDGDTVVVGAFGEDTAANNAGAVYVFTRDGMGDWSQQQKLTAADAAADRFFGVSVAVSGDRIVVGNSNDSSSAPNAGSAYVFTRNGLGSWSQTAKLTASDETASDFFGISVAVRDDKIIVGASQDDRVTPTDNQGSAYVFVDDGTGSWIEFSKLVSTDTSGELGRALAISSTDGVLSIVAGAFSTDDIPNNSGAAYFFEVVVPETSVALIDNGGGLFNLLVTDQNGGVSNDNLTIRRDPLDATRLLVESSSGSLIYTDGSGTQVGASISVVIADITGQEILVNTLGGDDLLTLDFTTAEFLSANGIVLTYNAGETAETNGDEIAITGGTIASFTYNVTGNEAGNFDVGGTSAGDIFFTQTEPATITSVLGTVTVNIDDGVVGGTLNTSITNNGNAADGILLLNLPGMLEDMTFTVPTVALIINGDNDSDDVITITSVDDGNGNANDFRAALTIDGRGGADTVHLNTALISGAVGNTGTLSVTGELINVNANVTTLAAGTTGDVSLIGTTITLDNSADIDTTAAVSGDVSLTATRNIAMTTGTSITTDDGDITLSANQQVTATTGNFVGVLLDAATVTATGSGVIDIDGRGGNGGGGSQQGVRLQGGAVVSGGSTALATTVTVDGTGGASTGNFNHGVRVTGASSRITSVGGDVEVTGVGGGGGVSGTNLGVHVESGGEITAGLTGAVIVDGTGGAGSGNNNEGVRVIGTDSRITSNNGSVEVIGVGGGTGGSGNNFGVYVQSTGQITAGGTGTVTVDGTGGGGSGNANHGVLVSGASSRITSTGGVVDVTGQGGGNSVSASNSNVGVRVDAGGEITATGTAAVTVDGTGGVGTGNDNYGVQVAGTNSRITSGGGTVDVIGLGGGTGASGSNIGVRVDTEGQITSGGTGAVTVDGTGGATAGTDNYGVQVSQAGSRITSNGGTVDVTGLGGGTGTSGANIGVNVLSAGEITAGGMASVTVDGTGGAGTGTANHGVQVTGANSRITSTDGAVEVTGQGGGTGISGSNFGVVIASAGRLTAGGAGTVTVSGTGGAGTGAANVGVFVSGADALITAADGSVNVTGHDGSGASGLAISLAAGGAVTHTADGNISLIGDSMDLAAGTAVNAGAGTVTIRQLTNGVGINLGSATDTIGGPLALTDAELDTITAETINIGNANTGAITVSAAVSRAATTNLALLSGDSINFSGPGSLDSNGGGVSLIAVGAITSGTATTDVTAGAGTITLSAGAAGIGASGNSLGISSAGFSAATTGNGDQFFNGTSTIDAAGLAAGAGTIEIDGGTITLGGSDRITDTSSLIVNGATAEFAMGANNETVAGVRLTDGSITGSTGVLTSPTTFDVRNGSISAILTGATGAIGLTKTTAGTVSLSGANTYTGATTVSAGTLQIAGTGSIDSNVTVANAVLDVDGEVAGSVTLNSGGILNGTGGSITGTVTVNAGGTVNPGDSPGILSTGSLSLANGSTFTVEIDDDNAGASPGGVAGTDYDQLQVTGTVTIGSTAVLNLADLGSTAFNVNDVYTIISNDGVDAVTGVFGSLTGGVDLSGGTLINGDDFTFAGETWRIYYNGGDGNDVILINRPMIAAIDVFVSNTSSVTPFDFTGLTPGTFITDVDFLTLGDQNGIYGVHAFGTVSEAVVGVDAGRTVHVNDGTYVHTGTLLVQKSMTIDGQGRDGVTHIRKSGAPVGNFDEAVRIEANDVTISDVQLGWVDSVSNDYQGYVLVLENRTDQLMVNNTTVSNVLFAEGYRSAIVMEGTDLTEISDSIFEGNWGRAAIRDGSGATVPLDTPIPGDTPNTNFLITRNEFREDHFRWGPISFGPQDNSNVDNAFSGVVSFNYFGNGLDTDFQSQGDRNYTFTVTNNGVVAITDVTILSEFTGRGLVIDHNTFDWNDSNQMNLNGVYAQPVGVYIDPTVTTNTNLITIQDNIFNNFAYAGPQPGAQEPAWGATGVFGTALEFDGADDFATFMDAAFNVGTAGSLSFWVNLDNVGKRNQFFEGPGDGGLEFQFRDSRGGEFFGRVNAVDGNDFAIQDGNSVGSIQNIWTHVLYTWDFTAQELHIYQDGTEVTYRIGLDENISNWPTAVDTVSRLMYMGRDPGSSSRYLDGRIDDVAWFDRALDPTGADAATFAAMTSLIGNGVADIGAHANLVAHWDLDTLSGFTEVDNINGITLNVFTSTPPNEGPQFRPTDGVFGGALEFDGVDDFATFQDATFDVGAEGTLNLWVNLNDLTDRNKFFEGTNSAGMEFAYRDDGSGQFFGSPGRAGNSNNFVIQSGGAGLLAHQWVNVQYTWNFANQEMHIFVDGTEVGYLSSTFDSDLTQWVAQVNTTLELMTMGRDASSTDRFFGGLMDDVAWFNIELTQVQLDEIRTDGVTLAQANTGGAFNAIGIGGNLVAYWNMDDVVGTTTVTGDGGTAITLNLQFDPPPPPLPMITGYGVFTDAATNANVINNVFFNDEVGGAFGVSYADSNQTLIPANDNITGPTANPFFNGDGPGFVDDGTLEHFYTLRFGSSAAFLSTEFVGPPPDPATLTPHIGANQEEPVTIATEDILIAGSEFDDLLVVTFTGTDSGFFTLTRDVNGAAPEFVGTILIIDALSITFDGFGGDDVFIIRQPTATQGGLFSLTNGITFLGGDQDGDGNALDSDDPTGADTLVLLTSDTDQEILDSAAYVFGNADPLGTGHQGTITLTDDSGALSTLITFTGLEPIRDELSVNDRSFTYNSTVGGGNETINVSTLGDTVAMTAATFMGDPIQPEVTSRTLNNLITSTLGPNVSFNNPLTQFTIDAGVGDDIVNINSIHTDYRAALTINGDGDTGNRPLDFDTVNINTDLTLGSTVVGNTGNLTVNAEEIIVDAVADGSVAIDTTAATTNELNGGVGNVSFIATRNIAMNTGSSITTTDGDITLSANQQATAATGSFVGVSLTTATVTATGAGVIDIDGRGGNGGGGSQQGVLLQSGAVVSGGSTALATTVTVDGTGGASTGNFNHGVRVTGTNSRITSAGGNVEVTGLGGGSGASGTNLGVHVESAGQITAGGTGTVTVDGTGGVGSGDSNEGVRVIGMGSRITSNDGNVEVIGQGGGTAASSGNIGVFVQLAGQITPGGTGKVVVNGTGGSGLNDNVGVRITLAGSSVVSTLGDILVVGTGGGTGTGNTGVRIADSGSVESRGSADITIVGDGAGTGIGSNAGIVIETDGFVGDDDAAPSDANGDGSGQIILDAGVDEFRMASEAAVRTNALAGETARIVVSADQIELDTSAAHPVIQAIRQGTGIAEVILAPDSGDTQAINLGVGANAAGAFALESTELNTIESPIVIIGLTDVVRNSMLETRTNQFGASFLTAAVPTGDECQDAARPFASETQTTITVVAGGFTADAPFGTDLFRLQTRDSANGILTDDVVINGSVDLATNNPGRNFEVFAGSDITQAAAAKVTTGDDGTDDKLNSASDTDSAGVRDGDVFYSAERSITIIGDATVGDVVTTNGEVTLLAKDPSQVVGGGANPTTGDTFTGITLDDADVLTGDASLVTPKIGGDILLQGTGGDTGSGNVGVHIHSTSTIDSRGSGATAGTIVLVGNGGPGTDDNSGVVIENTGTLIRSIDGNVSITGDTTAVGDNNSGIELQDGAVVESTGVGTNAATITLDGTGRGVDGNEGIQIEDGAEVLTVDGNVEITGRSFGTGDDNKGVEIRNLVRIESTGTGVNAGEITIDGTGRGVHDNAGIQIEGDTLVRSLDGDIAITGRSFGTSSLNTGIEILSGSLVSSTGAAAGGATITVDGTGGPGEDLNVGVVVDFARVTSVVGDIEITGQGGASAVNGGSFNAGVVIVDGGEISSTGNGSGVAAAKVTIDGTAGNAAVGFGGTDNVGVFIADPTTLITSEASDITITGQGGASDTTAPAPTFSDGVDILDGAVVRSTGTGVLAPAANIEITGTGGIGNGDNVGVVVSGTDARVTAVVGNIDITGVSGDTGGALNRGVLIEDFAVVDTTGNNGGAGTVGNISIDGTGRGTGSQAHGVDILDADVQTADGNVTIVGRSTSSGAGSNGVLIQETTEVRAAASGSISITGTSTTAAAGGGNGVAIVTNSLVAIDPAGLGTIAITGTDGSNTDDAAVIIDDSIVRTDTTMITITGVNQDVVMSQTVGTAEVQSNSGSALIQSSRNVLLGIVDLDLDAAGPQGTAFINADADTTPFPLGETADGLGGIVDNLAGEGFNIRAAAACLVAGSGIGDADDIDTALSTLAALNTTSGAINVQNTLDLALGTVGAKAGVTQLGPGAVALESTTGAISDGGDAGVDITAENPASVVTLTSVTGIGVGNPLDTSIAHLVAAVTGTGGIEINEISPTGLELQSVTTANGPITVTSAGTILATLVDSSATDNNTNDIQLSTTGVGNDILVTQVTAGLLNDVEFISTDDVLNTPAAGPSSVIADDLVIVALNNAADGPTAVQLRTNVQDLLANVFGGNQGNLEIVEVNNLNLPTDDSGSDARTISTSNGVVDITTGASLTVIDLAGGNDDAARTSDVEIIGGGAFGGVSLTVGGDLLLETFAQIDAFNAGLTPVPLAPTTVTQGSTVTPNDPIVLATVQGDVQWGAFSQVRTMQAGTGTVVGVARQIASRPDLGPPPTDGTTAFYDASSIISPTLTRVGQFFQANLQIAIGQPGETGLSITIDWGTDQTDRFETITGLVGGMTYTFVHDYSEFEILDSRIRRSSAADPLSINFGLTMEGSTRFLGNTVTTADGLTTIEPDVAATGSDFGLDVLTSTDLDFTLIPDSPFADGTFIENGLALVTIPSGVGSGIPNFIEEVELPVNERQAVSEAASVAVAPSVVTTDNAQQAVIQVLGREEYLELRVLSPDPDALPLAIRRLPDEFLAGKEGASFTDLFDGLPDGTYEIWYVLGSNRHRLVRVEVRNGKAEVQQDELEGGKLKLEEIIDHLREQLAPVDTVTELTGEPPLLHRTQSVSAPRDEQPEIAALPVEGADLSAATSRLSVPGTEEITQPPAEQNVVPIPSEDSAEVSVEPVDETAAQAQQQAAAIAPLAAIAGLTGTRRLLRGKSTNPFSRSRRTARRLSSSGENGR